MYWQGIGYLLPISPLLIGQRPYTIVLYKGEIRKMPHSYSLGKPEAVDYILKNVSKKAKILDVGPGVGTYSDLLTPHGYVLDLSLIHI